MNIKKLLTTSALAFVFLFSGCADDDFVEIEGVCPLVVSTNPANAATEVPINKVITATFNEKMNPLTITKTSFIVTDNGLPIDGTVTYTDSTALFTPITLLDKETEYTGTIKTTVKDLKGNALQEDYVWVFTTVVPLDFSINVTSSPTIGGVTAGGGQFEEDTEVTVTALPNLNYTFVNWKENGTEVSTNVNYKFVIVGDRNLIANYIPKLFAINLSSSPTIGGTTAGAGSFDYGTSRTVVATPSVGYTFVNWTVAGVAVSNNASYTFVLDANKTLVANFVITPPSQFTINLSAAPAISGSTSGAGTFNAGSSKTVIATPSVGYTFVNWTAAGVAVSNNASYTFVLDANKTLVANFIITPPIGYTISLSSNPTIGGSTSGAGTFDFGTSKTVTATPNAGYTFVNWTAAGVAVSNNASYTFVLNANKTLVANFVTTPPNQFAINLSSNPVLGGSTSGAGTFNAGSSKTVTATPNTGYTFVNWTEGGIEVSTNTNYTFVLNANKTLVANFVITPPIQLAINLSSNPVLGGSTSGSGTFNIGSSKTVTATPSTGYTFVNWTEGGIEVSTNTNYTFVLNANKTLVANFTASVSTFSLNVTAVNGTVVKNPNTATYNSGATVQLTATPNSGYKFISWSGDATGSVNPLTVTMNSNKNITSNFSLIVTASYPALVPIGAAGAFAILGGSGVSNTGTSTVITGNVGSFPTATINGLLPSNVIGTLYTSADPIVGLAKDALTVAFNDAQSRSLNAISLPGQLGGLSLAPGLYVNSTTSGISGTGANGILTLDAGGDSNAVWIFKMGSTFITDAGTQIVLAGGAKASNIFWSVGTSATLGTNSIFYGNILADQSITLTTGATLYGRALTRVAAVTLDASTITKPN